MNRVVPIVALALMLPAAAVAAERGLLWRVVQTCVATHRLIGTSFPCLAVNMNGDANRGYAVVRAPFDDAHVVVTPTVRTIGIEAERLRASDAPNYFADAWSARHFVTDTLPRPPDRSDLALAVNSRPGRSQDQLHIHVDCVRQSVKRAIASQAKGLRPQVWTRVAAVPGGPRYSATPLEESDLAGTNIFKLAQTGLGIQPSEMSDVTIVVVGAELQDRPGFVVLARRRAPNGRDDAHGEALMDHGCSAFR